MFTEFQQKFPRKLRISGSLLGYSDVPALSPEVLTGHHRALPVVTAITLNPPAGLCTGPPVVSNPICIVHVSKQVLHDGF
jgi:hypothetical protein